MGRLSYNYDSKYYFDVTVRHDGSSNFAPGFRYGTFPSANVAWRASSEKFLENASWINDLKFRAGWGQLGNQDTLPYLYLNTVRAGSGVYGVGGVLQTAAFIDTFAVADVSWETVTTQSIGFDAILFDNKINFTAEYYHRLTEDILQESPIPTILGNTGSNPFLNIASVENQGFEFNLGYNDSFGDLNVNANFNLTTVRNRVIDVFEDRPTGSREGRVEPGQPLVIS